ncbi:hypothetical protein DL768_002397 [Monosporascus sp. mg162]|nr:hypothetical protein DL768_002397 [Monosporascus sp. mg162]
MANFNPDDYSRFSDFDIIGATYKIVSGHEISSHILIPKRLTIQSVSSAPCPILLRIHGGGFVSGSSLFPDFFAPWHLELASRHSAVIVTPDYRLAPESTIDDAIEDIEDFWKWIHVQLPSFVHKKTNGIVRVDTSRIMTAGDSAGGYFSLLLGLRHPEEIRAVTAAYPLVDSKSRHFVESYEKPMFGFPHLPASLIEEHRDKIRNGQVPSIISADPRLERAELMFGFVQHGAYKDIFPQNRRELFLLDKLDDGARFPRGGVFLWHGKGDTVVPVEGSIKLSDKLRDVDPNLKFRLAVEEGDHGFDANAKIDDEWMANGLRDLLSAWLG